MKCSFLDIFTDYKETGSNDTPNLTEESIYSYTHFFLNEKYERVPVLSASTIKEGVIGYLPDLRNNKELTEHKEGTPLNVKGLNYYKNKAEGCITVVADGVYAGYSFFRSLKEYPFFCANTSCLILFKKDDAVIKQMYPAFDGMNLEWFNLKFHNLLQNIVRGSGVKHFTRTICENIDDLEIPKLSEQLIELKELKDLDLIQRGFNKIKNHINEALSKEVNGFAIAIEDEFNQIFNIEKGTGGFTEEAIYHSMPSEGCKQVPIFGGEQSHSQPDKYVNEIANNKHNKRVKYFDGNCLVVSMDGSAGYMTFKQKGKKFTLNHHAAVLTLKKEYDGKINLKWFKHEYQNTLIDASVSKKGSRTLSKEVLDSLVITAPITTLQDEWVTEIEDLEAINERLGKIQLQIENLSEKEVI